jgi:hypothetical protein
MQGPFLENTVDRTVMQILWICVEPNAILRALRLVPGRAAFPVHANKDYKVRQSIWKVILLVCWVFNLLNDRAIFCNVQGLSGDCKGYK